MQTLRAALLLGCLALAAAQACQSTFYTLPSVELGENSRAYLEWPPALEEAPPGEYVDPKDVALEFCKLNMMRPRQIATVARRKSKNLPVREPSLGAYRPAFPELVANLPLVQISDPGGVNVTVCEGSACSIFGVIECVPFGAEPCQPDAQGNIGNGNVGQNNVGNSNTGSNNFCNGCSGSNNNGDFNAGSFNLGTHNSGSSNVGSFNAGTGNVCWNTTSSGIPFAACPEPLRGPFVALLEY